MVHRIYMFYYYIILSIQQAIVLLYIQLTRKTIGI